MSNPVDEPEALRERREKINRAALEIRSLLRELPEFGKKYRIPPGCMVDYMTPADCTGNNLEALERDIAAYFTKEPFHRR